MITSWKYNLIGGERPGIKALIKDNNLKPYNSEVFKSVAWVCKQK